MKVRELFPWLPELLPMSITVFSKAAVEMAATH